MIRYSEPETTPQIARSVTAAPRDEAERAVAKQSRVTKNTVTKNAVVTKKRGRPAKADVKSQADRARDYRKRRKAKTP
jgi:hypothetical protein